jgi:hypothetical protein
MAAPSRAPSWPSSERLECAFACHDLSAWLCGRRSAAPIVKNNRITMTRSPGPSKPVARRPNDMQSLHGQPLSMMPAMSRQ